MSLSMDKSAKCDSRLSHIVDRRWFFKSRSLENDLSPVAFDGIWHKKICMAMTIMTLESNIVRSFAVC